MTMTTPTEAEIREAVGRAILDVLKDQAGDVVGDVSIRARDALWADDWRAAEEATYDRLVAAVYDLADEAVRAVLRDGLVDAFRTFGEAHPDAPRARAERRAA
jgi:hypothetical protein